jgi:short-subunit dehydrogenase
MKTVLITGCSSGFGLTMVQELLNDGHYVIATLRSAESRMNLFDHLQASYKENLRIESLDVTLKEDRDRIKQMMEKEFDGKLNVLINNAGTGYFGALEDYDEDQIRKQMEVNFFAPTLMIKEFLPLLRNAKGKIINITSIMGQYSTPLGSLYSASKYALEGISEGLYYELDGQGVQVTTIAPGGHRTNFLESSVWAKNSKERSSIYFNLTQSFIGFTQKLSSRPNAPDSGAVASTVKKLVKRSVMPRQITVGKDAKMVILMKRILPFNLYQKMMKATYNKVFKV